MDTDRSRAPEAGEPFVWPPPFSKDDIVLFTDEEDTTATASQPEAATDRDQVLVVVPAVRLIDPIEPVPVVPAVPAQSSSAITLATVLETGIPVEWHEVVAVVQQLADQYGADGRGGGIPSLAEIVIERDGRLHLPLVSAQNESPVRAIGHVLNQFLNGRSAPAGLRLIGSQAVSEVPTLDSLQALTQALAQFERPNRLRQLVQLRDRAAAAAAARPAPPSVVPAPTPEPPKPQPKLATEAAPAKAPARSSLQRTQRIRAAVAALAIAACVALIVVIRLTMAAPRPVAATSAAAAPVPAVADTEPDGSAPASAAGAKPAATNGARTTGERQVVQPSRTTARSTPSVAVSERVESRTEAGPVAATAPILSGAAPAALRPATASTTPLLRSAAPSATSASAAPSLTEAEQRRLPPPRIYSSADDDVVEPILARPQLPQLTSNTAPHDAQSVLELVIDQAGDVESVRLRSPVNRYRDRWWVSVAKSWRFEPALKDGQPVRFRKQIVITDFPEPAIERPSD
jgi:hypothetical protein